MKNFTFLILSAMILVLTYTAPLSVTVTLLEQIKDEANKILHNNSNGEEFIYWPETNGVKCWKQIFCMAEKALEEKARKEKALKDTALNKLTHLLEKFNSNCSEITCELPKTNRVNMMLFLEDLIHCVAIEKEKCQGTGVST